MKRIVILIYQVLICWPVYFFSTVMTAFSTTVGCMLGGERIFSYYPGMIWSKIICAVSLCPVRVKGREHLKAGQSYIFVANHQGAFDIFLLYGYLHFPIKWIMKKSLRNIFLVGRACEAAGFIFVDHSSPMAAIKTIDDAKKKLTSGFSVILFPEGSRSKTGKMDRFKKGAFQMALDLQMPIVPITINGSFEVLPRNSFFITPHKLEMIIHPPIVTDTISTGSIRDLATSLKTLSLETQEVIASSLWSRYKMS